MIKLLLKATLLTTLCLGSATALTAQANTNTVVYGRTTLQLNTSFLQTIQSNGVVLTDLSGAPLQNGSLSFKVSGGVLSLQNFSGELDTVGGILATGGGVTIRVQNLIVDLTNPRLAVVSGIFVVDGVLYGRNPIFNLQVSPNFSLSPLQQGAIQAGAFNATLTSTAATIIGQQLGTSIPAGTSIGTVNLYGVLAGSANSDK